MEGNITSQIMEHRWFCTVSNWSSDFGVESEWNACIVPGLLGCVPDEIPVFSYYNICGCNLIK